MPATHAEPSPVDIEVETPLTDMRPLTSDSTTTDYGSGEDGDSFIYRGQSPAGASPLTPGSDEYYRQAMPVSGLEGAMAANEAGS